MENFTTGYETVLDTEEVRKIMIDTVESTLGGNEYQFNRVNQWTSSILEQCLSQLSKLRKPYKYIVTCIITQKSGAGLESACMYFWDDATDESFTEKWGNQSMDCIIRVFALAI